MFDIDISQHTDCDGVTRRDFLRVGGLTILGLKKGPQNGMPPNMMFGGLPFGYGGAGYMGPAYNPFNINGDPNNPGFTVRDVSPPNGVDMERIARRKSILDSLDTFERNTQA